MKGKQWIIGYLVIVITALIIVAFRTVVIDPYFHFHAPKTESYFYVLNNERSQNDGITKRFDYEGIITGTSMTANFKTSEAEDLFGVKFIKLPYQGGSYREVNSNLIVATARNPKLKYIIRGLDMNKFFEDKDAMRFDMGTYPTYLYDDNWLNDVRYLFNRDVFFSRIYPMTKERNNPDFQAGMTTFDAYSNLMKGRRFGHKVLFPNGLPSTTPEKPVELSQQDIDTIVANVRQNLTSLAEKYPNIEFYYFFAPYSIAWWKTTQVEGKLDRQIDAEKIVIEEILKYKNIKLFAFNSLYNITTDLNHYRDSKHYGSWINSLMLYYMRDGKYQLTWDNYLQHLEKERQFYKTFDYTQLTKQTDYESDYYAAALLNEEMTGTKPYPIDLEKIDSLELSNATIEKNQYKGKSGLVCTGTLKRRSGGSALSVSEFLYRIGYVGAKIRLPDVSPYNYLVFYGKKETNKGQLTMRLYDKNGKELAALNKGYRRLDDGWHQYVVDISGAKGPCTLILNGGYIYDTGNPDSRYIFSDITLY